jgi:ribosomal protein L10
MDKNSKAQLMHDVKSMYERYAYVFVVNVSGLASNLNNTIRKDVLNAGGEALVIKNTINKIAVDGTSHVGMSDILLKIIGVSDGKSFYGADYVKKLATMPSLDVVRASLLSVMQSVQRKIAYSLSFCPTAIPRVISSNFESK